MDKKEEKINQEGLKPLAQQTKNRNNNVWLVCFFVLLSSLTVFVFHYSEKVFYNRVNFIFEEKNKKNPKKEESKWGLLNRRFLAPLAKIVKFFILILSLIIIMKVVLLKLRECFFGSEKKELKKVDDIRSIFFYDRNHHEAENEITKILKYLFLYILGDDKRTKQKLKCIINCDSLNYLINDFESFIDFFGGEKTHTREFAEAVRLPIKKLFHRSYYKNMNKSSFLLQNKNFCNYKNNACISFILSFLEYDYRWRHFIFEKFKSPKAVEKLADFGKIGKNFFEKEACLEKFDGIYKKNFDFVVKNMQKFFDYIFREQKDEDEIYKKEEENKIEEQSELESLVSSYINKKYTKKVKGELLIEKEEKNMIRFRYFLDGRQESLSITLVDFFNYLWKERVKKKFRKNPSYDEEEELNSLSQNAVDNKLVKFDQKNLMIDTTNNFIKGSQNNKNDLGNNVDNKHSKNNVMPKDNIIQEAVEHPDELKDKIIQEQSDERIPLSKQSQVDGQSDGQ